jgi:hypothetical protein
MAFATLYGILRATCIPARRGAVLNSLNDRH